MEKTVLTVRQVPPAPEDIPEEDWLATDKAAEITGYDEVATARRCRLLIGGEPRITRKTIDGNGLYAPFKIRPDLVEVRRRQHRPRNGGCGMAPQQHPKGTLAAVVRELRHFATCLEEYCGRQEKRQFKDWAVFETTVGAALRSAWTDLVPLVEAADRELWRWDDRSGGGQ